MKLLFFISIALGIACSSLRSTQEDQTTAKKTHTILFVGNSLTYTNNLPLLVKEHAKQKGVHIKTQMIAYPNYAIEDHWNDGQVQKLIASKKYGFVILQQGPSSQLDGRRMLIEYGQKYSQLCKQNDVQLCYFMVWPSTQYYHSFEGVIKNHTDAASMNEAILIPVGNIWKTYIESSGNYDYYGPDGFHPSAKGSQVAAEAIVQYLELEK